MSVNTRCRTNMLHIKSHVQRGEHCSYGCTDAYIGSRCLVVSIPGFSLPFLRVFVFHEDERKPVGDNYEFAGHRCGHRTVAPPLDDAKRCKKKLKRIKLKWPK